MKLYTTILISGMLLVLAPLFSASQNAPVTTAGSVSSCQNQPIAIPITVTAFSKITSFSLRLDFNPALLNYMGFSNINPSLSEISVTLAINKIIIYWSSSSFDSLSLVDGSKLLDLKFTFLSGSPSVSFNNDGFGTDCEYTDSNGNPLNDMPTDNYYANASITNLNPGIVGSISGPANVYQGETDVAYSVEAIPDATSYIWELPAEVTGTSTTESALLSFSNTALSGNISVKGHNLCGDGDPSLFYVNVYKKVELMLFLEGLFNVETQQMDTAHGNSLPTDVADKINLELHNSSNTDSIVLSGLNLQILGNCDFAVPAEYNGLYYIVVKHRNHIETWSKEPVPFSGSPVIYDFTTSNMQAFGDNLKPLSGKFVIYAGDVNQDKKVNVSDLVLIKNEASAVGTGYLPEDLNGDGTVDALDLILVDNNAANFVMARKP